MPSARPNVPLQLVTMPPAASDPAPRPRPVQRGAMHQYQRAQVESASPTRLVVLLYEGAIRFCGLARDAMERRDLEAQNTNLIRAQRIVSELLSSLNRPAGGEVAVNLANIYTHIFEHLVRANLYDKREFIDHAIALLTELRASWIEIDRMASGEGRGPDGANANSSPSLSDSPAAGRPRTEEARGGAVSSIQNLAVQPAGTPRREDRFA